MISAQGRIAPIILAAGASTRLGEPKALAEIGGRPVLGHILRAIRSSIEAFLPPIIIVGRHADEIEAAAMNDPLLRLARLVRNDAWASGRTGSFFRGAQECVGKDVLMWPADVPLVPTPTIDRVVRAWQAAGRPAKGWLAPCCERKSPAGGPAVQYGHPVVLGRDLAAAAAGLSPDDPLKMLRSLATERLAVRVEDRSICDDLDTPADLAELRSRTKS